MKSCPECGERLNQAAKNCACGWKETKGKAATTCRIGCGARADGDDALCGYHRALKANDMEAWKESQKDWREKLYANFRIRHANDSWGALIAASEALETREDYRELIDVLKKQIRKGFGMPLPYDPRASAEEIDRETDNGRTEELKARARAAVEKYLDKKRAA